MPSSRSKSQARFCCASSRRCSRLASRATAPCRLASCLSRKARSRSSSSGGQRSSALHDLVVLGGEDLVVDLRLVPAAEIGTPRLAGRLLVGGAVVLGEILGGRVGVLHLAGFLLLARQLRVCCSSALPAGPARPRRAPPRCAPARSPRRRSRPRSSSSDSRPELLAHVERDEEVAHRLGEGVLVLGHRAEPVELVAGLGLDRLAPQLHHLARRLRRRRAGQPLAHHQRDGVLHRRFRLLGDLVEIGAVVAVLQHGVEVGLDAVHAARADRLAARLLDGVEDGARLPPLRREAAMHLAVVAGEAQRHGVADAARDRRVLRRQPARRLRQPHLLRQQQRPVGGERHVEVALAGDRAHAARDGPLERLGRRLALLAIGHRSASSSARRWRTIPAARRRARADRTPPPAAAPARRTCSGT